jgi:uncharacterized protein (TIGR00369 family)
MSQNPEQTLAAWRRQQHDVEQRAQREPGLARPEQLLGRNGIEIFQAMLAGELPPPPITHTLGFALVEAEHGRAVFQGAPLLAYYNPLGSVHGGWIATLLDSAVACAIHTTLAAGKGYTTLELKVNYVRALTDKVPLVRAAGQVIHSGQRTGTAEGRLLGPDGTLYAHATTTCLVLEARG